MNPLASLALGQIGIVIAMIVYGIRINDLEKRLAKRWGKT
jgi:hypothetical protein